MTDNDCKNTFLRIRSDLLILFFLGIVTLALYWQVKHHTFVWDDGPYIVQNHAIKNGLTLKSVSWAFTSLHSSNWHPLTWLSHAMDIQLYGMEPAGHHLTNVFFHIANTLLLFLALRRMTKALWQSAFVAALFALHPLHVESVAWVAERKDLLCAFFWMLSLWGYARYVEQPGIGRYLMVVLFFILGLMSKPMLVTLPFVLLLLDYWPLKRFVSEKTDVKRLILEKVPFFALSLMSCITTFFAQRAGGAVGSLDRYPFTERLGNALVTYIAYIIKMFWPFDLALLYPHPMSLPWWEIAIACLFLAFIFFLVFKTSRRHPYLGLGWLWYMGTLVPVIGLVQVGSQAMADRYTYIPLIGLFIIIAWGVAELTSRLNNMKKVLTITAVAVLSIVGVTTFLQIKYWENSLVLFEHTINSTENNYLMHNNLGLALSKQGMEKEAVKHFHEAARIKPLFELAHYNLGFAYANQDKMSMAYKHFYTALRIKPEYAEVHNSLGVALASQGEILEANKHFREALRINPEYAEAHNCFGLALTNQGLMAEAIKHFAEALRLDPSDAKANYNLANILDQMGKTDDAVKHYEKALQINPEHAEAHNNLGGILTNQGRLPEAIKHFSEALRIKPEYVDAHNNIGIVLSNLGRSDEAIRHFSEVLRINPESAEAHNGLGIALANQGKITEATRHFSQALQINPGFAEAYNNLKRASAAQTSTTDNATKE